MAVALLLNQQQSELQPDFSRRSITSTVGRCVSFALLQPSSKEAPTYKRSVGRQQRLATSVSAASTLSVLLVTTPLIRSGKGMYLSMLTFLTWWQFGIGTERAQVSHK